jgi:hypothetical protein
MIIDIDIKNITDINNVIINIKQDNILIYHSNDKNVNNIKDFLLKKICDLEWKY